MSNCIELECIVSVVILYVETMVFSSVVRSLKCIIQGVARKQGPREAQGEKGRIYSCKMCIYGTVLYCTVGVRVCARTRAC